MVLPRIEGKPEHARVVDSLPQSGDGVSVMTTQPMFVPRDGVRIKINGTTTMKVRLVDCVGYMVDGVQVNHADGKVRQVKTPWSDTAMPFDKAAEFGTRKVITDHSTVSIMMTTDGTITAELPRANYIDAEDRVIKELKKSKKPFVVVVNSKDPLSVAAKRVVTDMKTRHNATAIAMDVENLTLDNIQEIFHVLLHMFGVSGFKINMPNWLTVLDSGHELIAEAVDALKNHTKTVKKLSDNDSSKVFEKSLHFESLQTTSVDIGTGIITYNIVPKPDLYYRVLSKESGVEIAGERELVAFVRQFGAAREEFEKIKSAMEQVNERGYGIVAPTFASYNLDKPTLYKQGRNFGVKFRASATSLHIVRVDVATEITPTIGSQAQSEEMLKTIINDYDNNRDACWNTNIFGKPLREIAMDGINGKATGMNPDTQNRMKRTITKIVNKGRGGIICIIL